LCILALKCDFKVYLYLEDAIHKETEKKEKKSEEKREIERKLGEQKLAEAENV